MRNIKHTLPVSLVLAIVIVILASVISMNKIENQEKQDISIYLNTILGTTHQGFRSWADRHKKNCRIWANEMLPLAEELLKVEPTNEELLKSEAEHRIRERLKPFYSGDDYEGFFLINRDNISIASSRDSNTGTLNVLVQHPDLLKRMWAGETVLTLPIASDVPLPGHGGVLVEERSTMFVGTPVKDKTGKIIALFALRINPNDNYTAIFERAQLGETRETYCVSDSGQMISHSRFRDWMENAGVVRPGESEILNVNVAVPSQHAQGTQLDSEPEYTEAAQSLMRGESKVNLKGYKNYTGDIVIGAWTWDYEYGFGIASEISKHEAFTGIRNIRFTVIALAVLIIALLVGMFNLFQWLNRKLADSERKYRIFFDNSPLGIYQSTPEGSIINANPALIKMLEFDSLSELKNRNLNEEGYDASSDVSREQFVEQIEKDNYIKGLEGVWKTKNGRSIYIRENARIVRNPDGTKYYDGIVEDISEKREAEEKIRRINEELERIVKKRTTELEVANLTLKKEIEIRKKAEERIRLIFNSSPYSAMLVDSDGTIHIANTMTEEYFGYNSAQFIGANIKMLIPEEEKLFKASYTDTDFEDPESIKMGEGQDLFARKADGKQFPVEVSLTPIEYDGEKMVLANIIDITKRIESEERIRKAKLEAERANHAKSEFLSRMSHEFRTPMNSILGFAQLLDMGEMDKKFKKNIRQILKNGKHLLELINEVLDIARIETNQISLSLEAIDVSNVINEVLDILNPGNVI
ncbi:PAS domain S-box-containing protein [Mariniphaga anaerophila]|uniref:histidine kinase n=1 Tax=Mariniphaga anaerophila TaxID=1484053 RepID=A0A1M5DR90_9BACT|nr:PAS domain S-box protein [Mariniphaga anaerophila]SHF69499.1 PAS domain S-box-containing protein [Mariniphaga anaerophila]